MARIIYGVAGEGFGHSSRSHLIGQHLMEAGNEVMFVASQKAYSYLERYFGSQVREIFGLCLIYKNRHLCCTKTFTTNLFNFCRHFGETADFLSQSFRSFSPDLVISDFEPFSAWLAWHHDIPFISIDHEHMLTKCKLKHNLRNWQARLTSNFVTRCHYFGASTYLILNFFRTPVKSETTILVPPVVRPILNSFETKDEEHLIVYTTDLTGRERLLQNLKSAPYCKFHVYGYNESSDYGNVLFKKTSTEGFLEDLATCRGVIATAGFSLISECLHFKKKMLLLPIKGQYEQMINGHYIEELGLGIARRKLTTTAIDEFLTSLDKPLGNSSGIIWPDNAAFFEVLGSVLDKMGTQSDIPIDHDPVLAME